VWYDKIGECLERERERESANLILCSVRTSERYITGPDPEGGSWIITRLVNAWRCSIRRDRKKVENGLVWR